MSQPDKILFLHIPKTAGMSLFYALQHWAGRENSLRFSFGGPKDYERYRRVPRERLSRLKLLSGHLWLPQFQTRKIEDFTVVTILRQPRQRLLSMFTYFKTDERHPFNGIVRGMDFLSFLEWFAKRPHASNRQCRFLCGAPNAAEAIRRAEAEVGVLACLPQLEEFAQVLSEQIRYPLQIGRHNASAKDKSKFDLRNPKVDALVDELTGEDQKLYERFASLSVHVNS